MAAILFVHTSLLSHSSKCCVGLVLIALTAFEQASCDWQLGCSYCLSNGFALVDAMLHVSQEHVLF